MSLSREDTARRVIESARNSDRRDTWLLVQAGVFDIPQTGEALASWLCSLGYNSYQYGPTYAITACGIEVNIKGAVQRLRTANL